MRLKSGTDEFDTNEDDDDKTKPVDWTPEKGFVTTDRRNIYPRPAAGNLNRLPKRWMVFTESMEIFQGPEAIWVLQY